MNHKGNLPEFITVTDGKQHEVNEGRKVNFPKGSIVAIDRGYIDYAWYNDLESKGIFFVARLKANAKIRVLSRNKVASGSGVNCDQTIQFAGVQTSKRCPIKLCRIGYRDLLTGKRYAFLTNNFKLSERTIANIYKDRGQIDLFFKWIKQNLKFKSFLGTSRNAVLTQIWIALCVRLMLSFLKFQSKTRKSLQEIIRLMQKNLFVKWSLGDLLHDNPQNNEPIAYKQMAFL